MRLSLLAALVALAFAAPSASALTIRGFHAYDAGRHITFKWTVCTSYALRAQTILRYARSGSYRWRRTYGIVRYRRGCSPWVLTQPDHFLNGAWLAYVEVGPNRPDGARSRLYTYYVG
jgi:hypothetical protein